ncbi:hypothetical protein AWV80_37535 [Cupriavidus sp. UYMU48A]|nr:hypothetical protein AWV80_37535 [Cupriavidus sp. UYMU48A]
MAERQSWQEIPTKLSVEEFDNWFNWLRVSQGCQICLKSFVGMTFADFRRDPLEFPIFGGR